MRSRKRGSAFTNSPVAVLAIYSMTYFEVSVLPLPLSPLKNRDGVRE
jgi:hypothetical protein